MRISHRFLITGLGALVLGSGAAIATAQDSQPLQPSSPESTPLESPQSLPPEQRTMENELVPRDAASSQEPTQAAPPNRTSTQDETTMARSQSSQDSSSTGQRFEGPPKSESALDEQKTQLADSTASVQAKFDALDTDHDGTIDRTEAQASDVLSSQFNALDISGDGKLSLAEFTAASNLASIRVDHRLHQE